MKGIKKALCLLVLLFSVALALPVTANASTNGHTAQEALAWARAQVGKKPGLRWRLWSSVRGPH